MAIIKRYINSDIGSSGDGLAKGTAWKNMHNIDYASLAAIIAGGDQPVVIAKGGGDYKRGDTLPTFAPTASGVAGRPIILMYNPFEDSGWGAGGPPRIYHDLTGRDCINFTTYSYIDIWNFLVGPNLGACCGVYFTTGNNNRLISCIVDNDRDLSTSTDYCIRGYTAGGSLYLIDCDLMRGYYGISATNGAVVYVDNTRILGTYKPINTGSDVRYKNSHISGYLSDTLPLPGTDLGGNMRGENLEVANWRKYASQPLFNVSVDDGAWPALVAATEGGVMSGTIADYNAAHPGAELPYPSSVVYVAQGVFPVDTDLAHWRNLHNAELEVVSHGYTHCYCSTIEGLFKIRYSGAQDSCLMSVAGNVLTLKIGALGSEVNDASISPIDLTASPNHQLGNLTTAGLIKTLNDHADYAVEVITTGGITSLLHSKCLADITDVQIKIAAPNYYTAMESEERLWRDEMEFAYDKLYELLTGGAGGQWDNPCYAWPGGTENALGQTCLLDYYDGGRKASNTMTESLSVGIDAGKISAHKPVYSLSDEELEKSIKNFIISAGLTGRILVFYGHPTGSEPSAAQWVNILRWAIEAGGVYTTLADLVAWLRTQTNVSGNIWKATASPSAIDLSIDSDSNDFRAGNEDNLVATDIIGTPLSGGPSIGAYNYTLEASAGLKAYLDANIAA